MEHIYIGPHARFWSAYYTRCPGAPVWDWVNRYSSPCPGNIADRSQAIGKFERWRKRGNERKAYWLHWRLSGKQERRNAKRAGRE